MVVVTHNLGLTVAEITDLRRKVRAAGASFKVTKNRLTRLALAGTKFEDLGKLFTGPTAIAYSKDPVAAAKVVANFAKGNDKLVILGGALGSNVLNVEGVQGARHLPSLDELRAKTAEHDPNPRYAYCRCARPRADNSPVSSPPRQKRRGCFEPPTKSRKQALSGVSYIWLILPKLSMPCPL